MTKLIPVTQSKFAIVDDADFDRLNKWHWHFVGGYAMRSVGSGANAKEIAMHREVLSARDDQEVDHINHDKLDQRRSNLRLSQRHGDNMFNRLKYKNNSTGYKGVTFFPHARLKYRARIQVRGRTISLGLFETAEDAARAYDEAAHKYHGEFAHLNF